MKDRIGGSPRGRYISLSAQTTMRIMPHGYPFNMLDRITACYPTEGIGFAVKHITLTDPVLSGHFPGYPIYPGVLIIEAMAQNAGMTNSLRVLYDACGSLESLLDMLRLPPGSDKDEQRQYVLAETKIKNLVPVFPGCAMELEARLLTEREGMYVYKVCAQVDHIEVARGQMILAEVPMSMSPGMLDRIGTSI